jgi:hypothetical protein
MSFGIYLTGFVLVVAGPPLRCKLGARTDALDCGGWDRASGARDPDGS